MTLAPRSASWRVVNGAATACSRETTVTPSRGRLSIILEGPRETEDVLGDVGKYEVRRDGGDLEEPGLPELALDVVLGIVAVAAVGLHRDVPRLPSRLRGQHRAMFASAPEGSPLSKSSAARKRMRSAASTRAYACAMGNW